MLFPLKIHYVYACCTSLLRIVDTSSLLYGIKMCMHIINTNRIIHKKSSMYIFFLNKSIIYKSSVIYRHSPAWSKQYIKLSHRVKFFKILQIVLQRLS